MTNESFLSHINNVLTQSELSRTERRQLEEMLKSLLENYTPEELLQVLLEMIGPMHKTTCQV
ncbi:hypothetical protein DSH65_11670 [Enterococcus faecalis]|uniref:Uncharacterized protein n=4 Tax=Enterococcus TaxID=1350 RepID=S1QXF4_9ENTE|nr:MULTISPECIES: hypothetical protein [Enterococcus]EOD93893.1 hypothetical protein Q9E_01341 [Enterococcus faecalis EnGen0059]EOK57577.1 hypothetical protein Q9C_02359 [Enterococcus faecalis EnGen0063]EGO2698854.1 hypothetical protein [Enterococcus faecalis]EGO2743730.1 hypothetical protein [Enterococcus faecalis]EGO2804287.1 hypothetical protein [Enterococcus faecalis]